jgi:hypothetical protein
MKSFLGNQQHFLESFSDLPQDYRVPSQTLVWLLWIVFCGMIFCEITQAEDTPAKDHWVNAEGVYVATNDLTFSQARYQALKNARRSAIEEATGVAVNSYSSVTNFTLKDDLIRVMARGIILEETISRFEIDPKPEDDLYIIRLGIRAKVRTIPSEHRGAFQVSVRLNREVYTSGDQAVIQVMPSEDSFLYIFNVTENDHITILVPNRLNPLVKMEGGQTFQFPTPILEERGVTLTTLLPQGKARTLESIKVIATKKPIEALQRFTASGIFQEYSPEETGMVQDLLKTLVLLDPLEWTEGLASYQVTVPALFTGPADDSP